MTEPQQPAKHVSILKPSKHKECQGCKIHPQCRAHFSRLWDKNQNRIKKPEFIKLLTVIIVKHGADMKCLTGGKP
jgi:hypothetical protein